MERMADDHAKMSRNFQMLMDQRRQARDFGHNTNNNNNNDKYEDEFEEFKEFKRMRKLSDSRPYTRRRGAFGKR